MLIYLSTAARSQRHTVKFQTMPPQTIAQLGRDLFLQGLDIFIDKFDDPSAFHVDQVIMVIALRIFVRPSPKSTFSRIPTSSSVLTVR